MNNPENNQPQSSVSKPDAKKTSSKLSLITAILMALAVIAGAWYLWQLHLNQQQTHAQIAELQKELSHANEVINQQGQNLKTLQQESQALEQKSLEKQSSYVLLEVNYLVKLAAFHLTFDNNVRLASQLLETADTRIADEETPALLPLRQALAKDIATLNAAPTVDLSGLMARLETLSQQMEQLPQTPIPVAEEKKTDEKIVATVTPVTPTHSFLDKLKKFGDVAGHALSDMVIISKDSKTVPTLLTAEERLYIITNIQAQLTLAEWALVHRQQDIYQKSLSRAETWLQHYFSTDNSLVKSALKTVADLKAITVNPETPTISRSLDALKQIKK